MRVGFVVDGLSEVASLPTLYQGLEGATGVHFQRPFKANIQPNAPIGTIVGACVKRVSQVLARDADLAIVLLDREGRGDCPGQWAEEICSALQAKVDGDVAVVVKNRMYENWLIADLNALRASTGRYGVSKTTASKIQPNKADNVDAMTLIKRCCKADYDKVKDSKIILEKADPLAIAAHSRSFRRLLRCIRHPIYLNQSQQPV